MTMLHANSTLTKDVKKVLKPLEARYAAWLGDQKVLKAENDQLKQNQKRSTNIYLNKVLNKCKAWNGPCTTVDQLQRALQDADSEEDCVTWELIFFRLVHQVQYKQNKQL